MAAHRPPAFRGRAGERELLDRLLENVRGGQSAVLVVRGEAGVGKTALLHYCARQASGFRVAQIAGVESEMELPFAGLHQLCAPMLGRLDALPEPQRDALRVALGLSSGDAARPLPRRAGGAQPAGRGRRGAAAALPRRRRAVARRRLGPGPRLRRPAAAGRVGGDRVRRARAERRARAGRPAGAAARGPRRGGRARAARDGRSPAGSTSACATASSPRRAAIRWRCWSCPRALERPQLAGGFGLPATMPLPGRIEEQLPAAARGAAARRRGGCCCSRRPTRSATRRCCGARPQRLGVIGTAARARGDAGLLDDRRARAASAIRSSARPSTARRRRARAPGRAPGAGRRDRPGARPRPPRVASRPGRAAARTRTSPPSSSGRPGGRRRAAGWPPPRPSWSAPRT